MYFFNFKRLPTSHVSLIREILRQIAHDRLPLECHLATAHSSHERRTLISDCFAAQRIRSASNKRERAERIDCGRNNFNIYVTNNSQQLAATDKLTAIPATHEARLMHRLDNVFHRRW